MMKKVTVCFVLACASACGQANKSPKPECDPKTFTGMTINGHPFKCSNGKLVLDEEEQKRELEWADKEEKERSSLVFAGLSRLLSAEEMKEVERRGPELFLPTCIGICNYDRPALERQFNALLLQQFKFRIATEASR